MIRAFLVIAAAWMLPLFAGAQRPEISLEVGQVWTVLDAETPSLRLTIEKIEVYGATTVVHVSLGGAAPVMTEIDGVINEVTGAVSHAPFEKSALLASLGHIEATNADGDPQFDEGYAAWRDNNGGIFTISVAQAVAAFASVLRNSIGEEI